ncbi:MAG: FecR family protein [Planctomycetota bacterium]
MKESDSENEKTGLVRSLWCRLINGVGVSDEEQTVLQNVLKNNDRLRQECHTDATVHALLFSMNDVKQSEDDFVRAVMGAVGAGTAETLATQEPLVEAPCVRLPGVQRRRVSPGRMAISATVMMFAAAGMLVWWASNHHQAGNGGRLVKGPVIPPAEELNASGDTTSIAQAGPDPTEAASPGVAPERVSDNATKTDIAAMLPADPDDDLQAMDDMNAAQNATKEEALRGPTLVTLTKIEDPVWEKSWAEGDRIGDDVVRLFGGRLELVFDDGAKVTLEGPVEFRPMTSGQLQLRRGRIMAAVPKEAIGFTVTTPTSQVVDLGTEFEVSVKETGASDVVVKKGEIEVMTAVAEGEAPRKWRLVPNGLNEASFFERTSEEDNSPVSAAIRGTDGAFQGMISINGQAAEFTSAEAFDDVRERVMEQFEKSQQETLRQWSEFVDSMQRNVQGTMQLNGAEVQFGNIEDVLRMQQQMMERMQIPSSERVNFPESSFTGSININGRVIQFRTREEYEAARRSAFGAAADFGAGDFLKPRKSTTEKNTRRNRP